MAGSITSETITALSAVPMFHGLVQDELASLAERMTEKTVPAGTVLTEEGSEGKEAMIILSGSALVRQGDRIIDEMGSGDFFGEMSLVNHAPRNATVVASSEVRLLVISADEFSAMLEANPVVCLKILRTVAARTAATADPGTI